jgi:hypothetical protein
LLWAWLWRSPKLGPVKEVIDRWQDRRDRRKRWRWASFPG